MVNIQKALTMSTAKAIVTALKQAGITKAFTVPGESFLPLLDALYDTKEIELITARH
ncbi:MAG: thiamine pyrophosphate-binding protein, partial [Caldibacillus sp.]